MFKLLTPLSQIEQWLSRGVRENEDVMADALCEIGRECVRIAKSLPQGGTRMQYPNPYRQLGDTKPNYTDWTTNLRNSIGWSVIREGSVYKKDTGSVGNTEDYLNELVRDYPSGIVLLVMATGESPRDGRPYAAYVQALGYDVLATSQLRGTEIARNTLNNLFSNAT